MYKCAWTNVCDLITYSYLTNDIILPYFPQEIVKENKLKPHAHVQEQGP